MKSAIKRHQRMRYPVLLQEFTEDGKTLYLAEVPDLPGCISHGSTPSEAIENVEEARKLWIKARRDEGLPIPSPTEVVDFSGKFLLRIPKSLHRNLTHRATANGVSLNQYAVTQLAEASAVEAVRKDMEKKFEQLADTIRLLSEEIARVSQSLTLEGPWPFGAAANVIGPVQESTQVSTWTSAPGQMGTTLAQTHKLVPGYWNLLEQDR